MPGGDQPGSLGSQTPDQSTCAEIPSSQKGKSDPESSKSDSTPSEYGSGLQTPDLTPDSSLSLPSRSKERSTGTEAPSEDKEIPVALTDSEISSKSDAQPSADSDTGSGLQSPDLKTDSSLSPTPEHKKGSQAKDIPLDQSCARPFETIKAEFVPPEDEEGDEFELEELPPQVETPDADPDRVSVSGIFFNIQATGQVPNANNQRIEGWANRFRSIFCTKKLAIVYIVVVVIIIIVIIIILNSYYGRSRWINATLPNGTNLPDEIKHRFKEM